VKKITSFTIDHLRLLPGVYVSRQDRAGGYPVTTFDLRVTRPNAEPVMSTGEAHAIEHLAATYLRSHAAFGDRILYFGPMGCRTGFYLLLSGDFSPEAVLPLLTEAFTFIRDFTGEIPGASARDCGNYTDMDLPGARARATRYLEVLRNPGEENLRYPQ